MRISAPCLTHYSSTGSRWGHFALFEREKASGPKNGPELQVRALTSAAWLAHRESGSEAPALQICGVVELGLE
jgi:hypothetical protein